MIRSLVVCIGNDLVADDGVGPAVFEVLRRASLSQDVRLWQLGVAGVNLLELFESDDLFVLVDAARSGDIPGTSRVRQARELDVRTRAATAHDVGVFEAMAIGRLLQPTLMPRRTLLVTVEGACFDELGAQLSPIVAAAIPGAASLVSALVTTQGHADDA